MRDFHLRENRVKVFIYVFLLLVLTLPNYVSKSKADVIPAESTGTGNFIPVEDCSLIMTDASVILNIDYVKSSNKIYLSFNGNYTIYNPNKSVRMTLVAPFSDDFKNLESSCLIKTEGNVIPFSFRESDLDGNLWEKYFDWRWTTTRKLVIIDMDFPENDSIEFEYIFDAYININDYKNSILEIFYDVGTARAWNGTITERVEFNVYGKRPNSYSNYTYDFSNYIFMLSDIEDGQSYVWEWENEVINADSVYISYSYVNYWGITFGKLFIILFYPVCFLLIIIIIVIVRRRAKRKT